MTHVRGEAGRLSSWGSLIRVCVFRGLPLALMKALECSFPGSSIDLVSFVGVTCGRLLALIDIQTPWSDRHLPYNAIHEAICMGPGFYIVELRNQ